MKLISGTRVDVSEVIELGSGLTLEQAADGIPKIIGAGVSFAVVVTEAPYNATGDGSTDDTAAIQAAIDDAFDADGGIVFFPSGTYLVSQLLHKSNVWLYGAGWSSIIKCKNANHTTVSSGTSTGSNTARTLNNTGASFTADGHKNQTVHITGGTGAGQKRTITHAETTTQLAISDDWAVIPNATSTYSIYDGKHTIVLDVPATTGNTVVYGLRFDGNKANQTALVDCLYYSNFGWSDANHDSRHLLENVLIDDYSGSGLTRSTAVREMGIHGTHFNRCDGYGSRNLLDQNDAGASDCKFVSVIASKCGLSGFSCGAGHDLMAGCKSFGNGTQNISGNAAGFLVFIDGIQLSACEAQENYENGFQLLLEAKSCSVAAGVSDANGGSGVLIDGTTDSYVQCTVRSSPGLLYTTANALKYVGGADRNTVIIQAESAQLSGAVLEGSSTITATSFVVLQGSVTFGKIIVGTATLPGAVPPETGILGLSVKFDTAETGDFNAGGQVYINQTVATTFGVAGVRGYARTANSSGTVVNAFGVHAIADHDGAGTVTNLFGSVSAAIVRAGTVTKAASLVASSIVRTGGAITEGIGLLVQTQTEGTTKWAIKTEGPASSLFSGDVQIRVGTDGSTTDTHLSWGKVSSPASGNPEFRIRTDASSQAVCTIESNDGTTVRPFITLDHANNSIKLGHAAGGSPFGEVRILPTLLIPNVDLTQSGDATHRWGQTFFGDVIFNLYGSTNAARTHFQWGRAGSPASSNPSYYLKTDASSTPKALIEGFDGTTTRTFITLDFAGNTIAFNNSISWGGGVAISSSNAVALLADNETISGAWTFSDTVTVNAALNATGNLNHTGTNWRLGNTTFGSLGASPGPWATSGITTSRTVNTSLTLAQLCDVVGTLVNDLFARGVVA